jgi:hypothetical protein
MSHAVLTKKEIKTRNAKAEAAKQVPGALRIGEVNDALEQEATRVADKVVNGGAMPKPEWSLSSIGIGSGVQRKCSCGGSGECEECKKQAVQRKATGPAHTDHAPPIVHEVLNSSGKPLDQSIRNQFEPRFGYDFSRVRLHTDVRAAQSARAIDALAYTSGSDIVFNQYSPGTDSGQKLLAHELAHVVQQQQAPVGILQRAPPPKPAASWWEEKGIGAKPQAKFWDDMHLFFPKDGRKFAGVRLDNIPNIDCDDAGIVSIGKGYWDEADGMKRKASIVPLIAKRDGKRFDEARIDDEDLTNEQIIAKLKALTGPGAQAYIAQLTARSASIKNGQVIAYLNGDDNEKAKIAASEKEKLLDWKFTADRLTDADFRDEKTNTRLRGLSTADKTAKAEKAKDFATKTGEETTKLQSFLQLQTTTSTPMPADANVSAAGGFTMNLPNVDVSVLPDQTGGRGNVTGPESNFPKGQFKYSVSKTTGKITEFFKMNGKKKVPVIMPPKLQITIQTRFQDITKADDPSAYGKGTTAQDLAWGASTLRFHEGSHGKVYIDVIRSTNVPSLAVGTVTPADLRVITDMFNRMTAQSCQLVDQVGTTQDAYLQTPAGIASGIVSCNR